MAVYALSRNFDYFFTRLNPSLSFQSTASSEHQSIVKLLQGSILSPTCFLQGSYKQDTSIYTINDVDIVALCYLWQPGTGSGPGWSRDQIFDALAAPLRQDQRYKSKIRYSPNSMCLKIDLGIKVEILPVVYKAGTSNPNLEPFRLYRPAAKQWMD